MSPPTLPERIAAVSLDVGGVLTLPPVEDLLAARGLHPSASDILAAHHAGVAVEDRLLARRSSVVDGLGPERRRYYERFAAHIGAPPDLVPTLADDLDGLARREVPWGLAAPGAAASIADLNRAGVPVVVVSNSNGTVEAQLVEMGICQAGEGPLPRVEVVVDSSLVGVRKPDPSIFRSALAVLGADPAEVVHVGDTIAFDVAAAEAAGIAAIHYDATRRCAGDHGHIGRLDELVRLVVAGSSDPQAGREQ